MSTFRFDPPKYIVQTFAIGASQTFRVTGAYLRVLAATGSFRIGFDDGPMGDSNLGLAYRDPQGNKFQSITLENPSTASAAVSVVLIYGDTVIEDSRLNILTDASYLPTTEPATKLLGANISQLANGASQTFTGAPAGNNFRRSCIIVSNAGAVGSLSVYDDGNRLSAFVGPGATIPFYVSGQVKVQNDSGALIACAIAEIWQQLP